MSNDPRAIDVKRSALEALRTARAQFFDPEYLGMLRQAPESVRKDAAIKAFAVEEAYQTLLKTRIDDIRAELEANADIIEAATAQLKKRVKKLEKLRVLLDGVAALLGALRSVVGLGF